MIGHRDGDIMCHPAPGGRGPTVNKQRSQRGDRERDVNLAENSYIM